MIDIHTHILPSLDDGAGSMEQSLRMAAMAAESGTDLMVATPHTNQKGRFENYTSSALDKRLMELKRKVYDQGIRIHILPGMEIMASDDLGSLMDAGLVFGINYGPYHLLEFPFDASAAWIEARLDDVKQRQAIPLIAHPERYFVVQDHPDLLYRWLSAGCRMQINKGSMFGRFGDRPERVVRYMFKYDLVTCIGSDAHSHLMRTPFMRDARDYVERKLGRDRAWLYFNANPERILSGQPIAMHGIKVR